MAPEHGKEKESGQPSSAIGGFSLSRLFKWIARNCRDRERQRRPICDVSDPDAASQKGSHSSALFSGWRPGKRKLTSTRNISPECTPGSRLAGYARCRSHSPFVRSRSQVLDLAACSSRGTALLLCDVFDDCVASRPRSIVQSLSSGVTGKIEIAPFSNLEDPAQNLRTILLRGDGDGQVLASVPAPFQLQPHATRSQLPI